MSDEWIRERIVGIASETPPTQLFVESVVARGRAARRRRSTMRIIGGAAAVLVVVVVAPFLLHAMAGRPLVLSGAAPWTLSVTCASDATTISGSTVAASADGVHFSVSNTPGSGNATVAYRTRDTAGLFGIPGAVGGADSLAGPSQAIVWTAPPGAIDVYCVGRTNTPAVRVDVVDPMGFYRPGTLRDLGCATVGIPGSSPYPSPIGATEAEAIQRLTAQFAEHSSVTLTAEAAKLGYEKARQRLYVLRAGGATRAVALVQPDARGFIAEVYRTCS